MIKNQSKFNIIMIVSGLILLTLFLFSCYFLFNRTPVSAILNSNYTSIGNIFDEGGTFVDKNTYNSLVQRLGTRVGRVSVIDQGTPIVFTMAGRDWQVVYRDPNDSDTITAWMTEPFTTSMFHFSRIMNDYQTSYIREETIDLFQAHLQEYPVLDSIIVTPYEVSSQYQEAQQEQYTYSGVSSEKGLLPFSDDVEDIYWVPSFYELFSFWGLDNNDRGFSTTLTNNCWTRSGSTQTISGITALWAICFDNTNSVTSQEASVSRYGVRPACHISLSALAKNATTSISVETSDASQGSVSGGGEYDTSYSGNTTISATAINGYIFDYWQDSSGNRFYENPYTFPVTQSETYTAYFRLPQITITSSTSGSEIASTSTEKLDLSTRYTLTFNSNRYIFAIQLNGGAEQRLESINGALGVDSSCLGITYLTNPTGSQLHLEIFNIQVDVTINLIFVDIPQSYTPSTGGVNLEGVALQVSGGNGSNLEAVGEARITGYTTTENLTTIHVSAVATSGYYFVRWETNDDTDLSQYGSSADIPYNLVEGKILTAVFAPTPTDSQTNSTTNNVDDEIG